MGNFNRYEGKAVLKLILFGEQLTLEILYYE